MPSPRPLHPRTLAVLESTWLNQLVHERIHGMGSIDVFRAKVLASYGIFIGLGMSVIAYNHYRTGSLLIAGVVVGCCAIASCGFVLVNRAARPVIAMHCINVALLIGIVIGGFLMGGVSSIVMKWLVVLPVLAGSLATPRAAAGWLATGLATLIGFWALPSFGVEIPEPVVLASDTTHQTISMVLFVITVSVLFGVASLLQRWSLELMNQKEKQLQKSYEEALVASKSKSRFLAMMSHELRTPLNAIIGYSELLKEDWEDGVTHEETAQDLEAIVLSSQHLLGLISGILDLSKIEAGQVYLDLSDVSLDELMSEITTYMHPLVHANHNTFELEHDSKVLHTDYYKLKQILINLLANASKFTSHGVISLHVQIDGEHVIFNVSDTGIGMSPDALERIWEDFAQADESTTREYGGTGVGLSLVREFALAMRGDIHVESTKGEGSRFVLTIPHDLRH